MNPEHFHSSGGKYEPTANSREFARVIRDLFMGLVSEGFTEPQALSIIGTVVAAKIAADNGNSGQS
jgi:hypothetical protein